VRDLGRDRAARLLRQPVLHVADRVELAATEHRLVEHVEDTAAKCLAAVQHGQNRLGHVEAALANLADPTPEFVIGAYNRLFTIEKSFRMSKHDLKARPIYHHKRESTEAHLTIVFAALAVTRLIEDRTDWSIKKFVRTARRYRTVHIQVGQQVITAEAATARSPHGARVDHLIRRCAPI